MRAAFQRATTFFVFLSVFVASARAAELNPIKLKAEVTTTPELCDVRARIRDIQFGEDAIRVTTTFPVELAARSKNGSKSWVTIEVAGAAAPIGHDTMKASWGDAGVISSKFEQ